jgi:hypothetical protein
MTGNNNTTSFLQRQPVGAAAGITGATTAVLAAIWSVLSDAGLLTWLSQSSVLLINGAVIIVVTLLAGWWAQRHSTSLAAPKIASGTTVVTTDAATGVANGTTTL